MCLHNLIDFSEQRVALRFERHLKLLIIYKSRYVPESSNSNKVFHSTFPPDFFQERWFDLTVRVSTRFRVNLLIIHCQTAAAPPRASRHVYSLILCAFITKMYVK